MDEGFNLGDAIVTGFSGIQEHIPVVLGGAIAIAIAFWGAPKIIGLFKKVAK